jgi:hypothetical protein
MQYRGGEDGPVRNEVDFNVSRGSRDPIFYRLCWPHWWERSLERVYSNTCQGGRIPQRNNRCSARLLQIQRVRIIFYFGPEHLLLVKYTIPVAHALVLWSSGADVT